MYIMVAAAADDARYGSSAVGGACLDEQRRIPSLSRQGPGKDTLESYQDQMMSDTIALLCTPNLQRNHTGQQRPPPLQSQCTFSRFATCCPALSTGPTP
jgi:hypothetical protein